MFRAQHVPTWAQGLVLALSLPLPAFAQAATNDLLDRILSEDAKIREAAEDEFLELEELPKRRLLLQGFRTGDLRVATWCAQRLDYDQLSGPECSRAIDLIWAELLRTGKPENEGNLISLWASDDLTRYLPQMELAAERGLDVGNLAGQTHRMLRKEHIPLVCELALSENRELAEAWLSNLRLQIERTDAHRELVAETLLRNRYRKVYVNAGDEWKLLPLQPLPELDERPGLPPLLRACLRRTFLSDSESRDPSASSRVAVWVRRWLHDAQPGPADAELLLALLQSEPIEYWGVPGDALRALQRLGDPKLRPAIEAAYAKDPEAFGGVLPVLHACLAHLGSASSHEWLRVHAARERVALYLLLELDPDAGRTAAACWFERMSDPESPWARTRVLRRGDYESGKQGYAPEMEELFGFTEPWLRAGLLPIPAALHVLEVLVSARSKEAVLAVARLPAWKKWRPDEDERDEYGEAFAVFCELLEGIGREELRVFILALDRPEEMPGIEKVARGAPYLGLEQLIESQDEEEDSRSVPRDEPARQPHIERLLAERAKGEAPYYALTLALAELDHPAAVQELLAQFRAGRHYWIDSLRSIQYFPGLDPSLTELWMDEMETNCCRGVSAKVAFWRLQVELDNLEGPYFPTPATSARRWWKHAKGRLRYSRIVGKFVAGAK